MSMHTNVYLHENIGVGGVEGLGDGLGWRPPAWWFNSAMENPDAPSHFSGYIPISLVRTRWFGWAPKPGKVSLTVEILIPGDNPLSKTPGKDEIRQVTFDVPEWKGVVREDKLVEAYLNDKLEELGPETVLNMASSTFAMNSFGEVLLDNTIDIVGGGDNMGITGVGVLKWGKIGYIEVSIPETLHDSTTGIKFRPNLLGSTCFDGSIGTRWDRTITNVVCDNTHQWALSQSSDATGSFKIKRTKNFGLNMRGARQALGIVEQTADEFTQILHEWSKIPVSPKQFIKWLDVIIPVPDAKVVEKEMMVSIQGEMQKQMVQKVNTNSQTIALNKRDQLSQMYESDPRVAPWSGTKLGVAQLGNTWAHHEQKMKGAKAFEGNKLQARVEGQLLKVLDGSFAEQDEKFLNALDEVLLKFDPEGVMIPVGPDKPISNPPRKRASQKPQNSQNN